MWGSILIYLGGRLFQLVWGCFEISWAPVCVLLVGANLKLFVGRVVLFLLCLGTCLKYPGSFFSLVGAVFVIVWGRINITWVFKTSWGRL